MVDTDAEPDLEKSIPSKNDLARGKIDEERPFAFSYENRENIDGKQPSVSCGNARLKAYSQAKIDRPTTILNAQLLDNNSRIVSI